MKVKIKWKLCQRVWVPTIKDRMSFHYVCFYVFIKLRKVRYQRKLVHSRYVQKESDLLICASISPIQMLTVPDFSNDFFAIQNPGFTYK